MVDAYFSWLSCVKLIDISQDTVNVKSDNVYSCDKAVLRVTV